MSEPRQFERSLPMALLIAREAVMEKFNPLLREHDVSAQQWRVLRILNESDQLDATELAQRSFLMMPSLSRILKKLESRNYINRITDSEDQRRTLISISPEGRELVKTLVPFSEKRYEHIESILGKEKLQELSDLLEETITKLNSHREPTE